ncbi:hypothetical protein [Maridesulfovibrio sp.]|uniref:hypothetical protein n=1 Tax=unclassified Maridesulfovibrio TaxID=2794999 RepID=UPI003B00D54E
MDELLEQLKKEIPAMFAATEVDKLTGNAIRWRTVQNMRCKKKLAIPPECFLFSGKRKVLIVRDIFFEWWFANMISADVAEC